MGEISDSEENNTAPDNAENTPKEPFGQGCEWIVEIFEGDPDLVIKTVNPFNSDGGKRTDGELSWWNGERRKQNLEKDQEAFIKVFGDSYVPLDYQYMTGKDGERSFIALQKRVRGISVDKLIGTNEYPNERIFLTKNREQIADMLWGAKKMFVDFGTPFDFHAGNMMQEDETGKLLLIDVGSPTMTTRAIFEEEHATDRIKVSKNLFRSYKRLERIERYEEILNLSQEEKDVLDEKYGINPDDYFKTKKAILDRQDKLGITDEELSKLGKKMNETVEDIVDRAMNGKENVTGMEFAEFARKMIGNKTPTPGQETLLQLFEGKLATSPLAKERIVGILNNGADQE